MKILNNSLKSCLLILAFCLFSTTSIADEKTLKTEVADAYQAWCAAIATAKGDPSKIVKFYAPNAILMPTLSAKVLINHDGGLNDYFTHLTSYPNIQCKTDKLITQLHGNTAINSGLYTFSYTDKKGDLKETIPARFTFVYKKYEGQWLIVKHHSSMLP